MLLRNAMMHNLKPKLNIRSPVKSATALFGISSLVFLSIWTKDWNETGIKHRYRRWLATEHLDQDLLDARLKGPLAYDDPGLLKIIRKKYLIPPSSKPYNLTMDRQDYKSSVYNSYAVLEPSFVTVRDILFEILKDVKDGFFMEAGAVDGEFLSNSLMLERKLGWQGLLVEADSDMFGKLLSRNRKAWSSHCCLALHPYPHKEVFIKYSAKDDLIPGMSMFARGHGVLSAVEDLSPMKVIGAGPGNSDPIYEPVQCLPPASLLLALNITHVHFISLDVEGAETAILDSFPFDTITVDVWLVEHFTTEKSLADYKQNTKEINNGNNQKSIQNTETSPVSLDSTYTKKQQKHPSFQESSHSENEFIQAFLARGYQLYPISRQQLKENYIFIRTESEIYKRLHES